MQTPRVYLVAYAGAAFPIAELFRSRGALPFDMLPKAHIAKMSPLA
jgi:hypothetical protein